jgi:predicted ATPase
VTGFKVRQIRLDSFLSFAPGSETFELRPLNVLIGPNGSGKSNFIEAFELLRSIPVNLTSAVRDGGGAREWLWKGGASAVEAEIDVVIEGAPTGRDLRYRLNFGTARERLEVFDEAIEEATTHKPGFSDVFFYYRFQRGSPVINVKHKQGDLRSNPRHLQRDSLAPDQSVLSQRKDPDQYPELTWIGAQLPRIQTFREWSFGRYATIRQPQPADLPSDTLLPDASNLALVLNEIEHKNGVLLNQYLRRFFPRFDRLTTRVSEGTVQFYLHEPGFRAPIPPTRLSDGTIRFLALLATLLSPDPAPVVCIDEPELGLHPDAMAIVAELLVEASSRIQLVVTTHSDSLVSQLSEQANSIVVCDRLGSSTTLTRVEGDRLKFWLDNYRLGEIWRMGEIGGNM